MGIYEKNETMLLLGQQKYEKIITEQAEKQIKEIREARCFAMTADTAIDIYIIGFINGKRKERERKSKDYIRSVP